jgi:hypothetical protein
MCREARTYQTKPSRLSIQERIDPDTPEKGEFWGCSGFAFAAIILIQVLYFHDAAES